MLLFGAGLILFFPAVTLAQANLFISPATGVYKSGELFSVFVNVNTGAADINAASALMSFDNNHLEVVDLGFTRSIFSIWTEEPKFSNVAGSVRFSGGLPNPGFTGASGNILRITFKTKGGGQAAVVFNSGSVLANDGKGTNILDSLKGGLYSILAVAAEKPGVSKTGAPSLPVIVEGPAGKTPAAPLITEWPTQLEEGETLTIRGLGFANSKILVFFQKGNGDPDISETFSGPDGRFSKISPKITSAGFYRVWAKNVSSEGLSGPSSEAVTVEVIQPLFFRIGNLALNYVSIIVTLIALLVLLSFLFLWVWFRVRTWQKAQGKEIAEAEKTLHKSFDTLKDGFSAYLSYLLESKSMGDMKHREETTRRELKKDLEELEEGIEKEIEDIKKDK